MGVRAIAVGIVFATAAWLSAQERAIDTQRSTITIRVGKTGFLSAAAHDHLVSAPIASGSIDETALRVEFKVASAKMTVRPDPHDDDRTQATIQKDMEEMTLETSRYPEIAFQSTHAERVSSDVFKVDGVLTLHGASKALNLFVRRDGQSYTGHVVIVQTDFGIKPVSIGGGMIKVKDPVNIDFQVFAR
ncbi:MAG TPA: YceI family protein [Bryobacteraceae bacterium]|nr:YceI family protein [Bryobacteraceae bacterium]